MDESHKVYRYQDVGYVPQEKESGLSESEKVTADLSAQNLKTLPSRICDQDNVTHLLLDYNDLTLLPEILEKGSSFKGLLTLRFFSAIGNSLTSVPKSFVRLCQLTEIYLNENSISSLPDSFCGLKLLRILNLTGNNVEYLPENFGDLSSLEVFHCDENNLKKLPKTFGLLENLKELELGSNSLSVLSEGFGLLKSLEVLNLSCNKLETLPENFGNLEHLKALDISNNRIRHLPQFFKSVHSFQKLYVESNLLCQLPDWISRMSEVQVFSAKDNQLQNQPLQTEFANNCVKLKHLDLSGNFMTKLPENLGNCQHLEFLDFGSVIDELERRNFQNGNWISKIPDSLSQLQRLKELHFDENQISELPGDFGQLICLDTLDLGQNMLYELPESFGDLKSLRICLLSKNHLQWLPSNFGNLGSLEDLRLDDNELGELPESFSKLTTLKSLDLYGNRLTQIPEALHSLTNLIRLDMDSNEFKIPLSDIPQITAQVRYAERDPNLKDNWRGKLQRGVEQLPELIIKYENQIESNSECSTEQQQPSGKCNEEFLISAMKRNLSLWKSHSDTFERRSSKRRARPNHNHYANMEMGSEDEDVTASDNSEEEDSNSSSRTVNSDDDFEPPIIVEAKHWSGFEQTKPEKPSLGTGSTSTHVIEETECWDDEVESLPEYYDNVSVNVPVHPTKMYYPPVYNGQFTFAPHDLHVPDYIKRPNSYPIEEGQFENCDMDHTTEISVDPVF